MKNALVLSAVMMALLASLTFVSARELPSMGELEKNMFKDLAKQSINPAISGWGIGLNAASDSYLTAKFQLVSQKILPRQGILQILKDAKADNASTWSGVRDRVKAAIDANSTVVSKGRIQINKNMYILTGISRTNTTFSADIRSKPDYTACAAANVSAEDCENQAAKAGDISLTKKTSEVNPERYRIWAGTLDFNNTAYTFVALVNPQGGDNK